MTRIASKKPRKKKCANPSCRAEFAPVRPLQTACSVSCAIALADLKKDKDKEALEKLERFNLRQAKARLKTRSEHMREAQAAFNEYIRLRDEHLPCISCGRFHDGQWHAGHYRTVGAHPELRFEPLNVWKQCAPCNNHKSGDIVNYRINLVQRIGQEKVDWLEGPHESLRYSIEDIQAIKAKYRALVREMKRAAV